MLPAATRAVRVTALEPERLKLWLQKQGNMRGAGPLASLRLVCYFYLRVIIIIIGGDFKAKKKVSCVRDLGGLLEILEAARGH